MERIQAICERAYTKYAGADWDYIAPNEEIYEPIMKNRNAYIMQKMFQSGNEEEMEVALSALGIETINATTRQKNQQLR